MTKAMHNCNTNDIDNDDDNRQSFFKGGFVRYAKKPQENNVRQHNSKSMSISKTQIVLFPIVVK